jgi:hypothetical protein
MPRMIKVMKPRLPAQIFRCGKEAGGKTCQSVSGPPAGWRGVLGDNSRKGNLRTLRPVEGGSGVSERPKAAFGDPFIGAPSVIAGEIDVLPAKRRDMLQQGGVESP